jgi:hypothetical protein
VRSLFWLASLGVPAILAGLLYLASKSEGGLIYEAPEGSGAETPALGESPAGSSSEEEDGEDPGTMFEQRNFGRAVKLLARREGRRTTLLKLQVLPQRAQFEVRKRERAQGYAVDLDAPRELERYEVKVFGTESLEGKDFLLSRVRTSAPQRMVGGIREKTGYDDFEPTSMSLEPLSGLGLRWSVNGEGGGRTGLFYRALANGSKAQTPEEQSAEAARVARARSRRYQACIRRNLQDPQGVQRCRRILQGP